MVLSPNRPSIGTIGAYRRIPAPRLSMLTTISLALLLAPSPSSDWPQYRGPNRTGIGPEQEWAAHAQKEPLWSVNVGAGYSCPSIVAGRLVTIGYDAAAGVDRIVCLAAETGAEHWSFEFAATDEPQYHGGGTLTTPTLRDGLVYCLSRSGKFHVLELETGELVWSRDYAAELDLPRTFHGFSASPLLEGDRIYLQLGGRVAAVDAGDGGVVWQSDDFGDLSYSNLARIAVGEEPALATVLGMTFVVLRLTDGELLHEYPRRLTGNAVHCATPLAIGEDQIFLSTAYSKGSEMLRLRADAAPEQVWGSRRMRNKIAACVLYEDHLYGFDESMLRCMDLEGNSKWHVRGLGLGSLSIVGDRLLILSSDGELVVAEADPDEFRELSRGKVLDGGEYWTMPVAVGGLIYVRNSLGDLRCLDHRPSTTASGVAEVDSVPAPAPAQLFADHSALVGRIGGNGEKALQLRGTWSVPLRGLDAAEMTWTLVQPDRWDLRLDGGGLQYTYDGERSWAIEPQGPRMVEGEELYEARQLFALPKLFAPACPAGAESHPQPMRFAETECWRVSSPLASKAGDQAGQKHHYFAVDSGRLVGCEGDGLSTLVFRGSQQLGALTLPASVTRFRAEDGQEHTLMVNTAQWVDVPAELFELPAAVQRLLRTDAEIERDNVALAERFAGALARFAPQETDTPLGDDVIELRVHDGDLWFVTPEPEFRIDVAGEEAGVFPVDGPPIRVGFVLDEHGQATRLQIYMPGPGDGRVIDCDRLPE